MFSLGFVIYKYNKFICHMAGSGMQNFNNRKSDLRNKEGKKYSSDQSHNADRISVTPKILDSMRAALSSEDNETAKKIFGQLRYPDQALLFESIRSDKHERLIKIVADQISGPLLYECLSSTRIKITKVLGSERIGKLLENMNPEDATDFLENFSRAEQLSILKNTNLEKRKLIRSIINSPENSAASIMSQDYIIVDKLSTISQVVEEIKNFEKTEDGTMHDIFISDLDNKIIGITNIISIACADKNAKIDSIMKDDFITIKEEDSTRDVVYIFNKYGINTAPVVNKDGKIIGAISIDTVRYIADEHGEEDLLKLSGVLSDLDENIVDTAKIRFVWLLINLITTALASYIISFFESTIHQITALAVLMPITVSMGSNAGTQTVTVIIRALATKHLNKNNFSSYFNKEMLISIFNGLVFGIVCTFAVNVIYKDILLACVFGIAICLTTVVSVLSGVITPIVMRACGTDPAITSVVFLTAIIDVVAFISFLGLAKGFLT